MSAFSKFAFTLNSVGKFVPALTRSGIIRFAAPPKETAGLVPNLTRYWFTLAREIEQSYASCPDRLALIDDDGALTYRQIRNQSRTLAQYLLSLGHDEIHMGVMARNGRGIILPMTAKGYAGATIYLLNVGSSHEQLEGTIKECGINVLFYDEEFADRIPQMPGITYIQDHTDDGLSEMERIVRHPENYASVKLPLFPHHGDIVLMSSGTSGVPKGVIRPEPKLPTVVAGILRAVPLKADTRVQITASMFHTWGWSMVNLAFSARITVITQRVFDPENCLRQIEKYKTDGLVSSPIFLKHMLQVEGNEKYDTSSLRYIVSSGHALTPEIVHTVNDRFGEILCNVYGSTELTLAATASAEELAANPTGAGKISYGTVLKILDKNGNEVPQGQTGRIHLTNSTALTGYTNKSIPIKEINGLVEIGDLGYIDNNGMLNVRGRIDDMIIVGGENVYPRSVEDVLEPMPGIADLAATGVDDEKTFQRIAVWIVRTDDEDGYALTEESVRQWVADNLAEHSIPRDVHFVNKLPRNATGKVMPRYLK